MTDWRKYDKEDKSTWPTKGGDCLCFVKFVCDDGYPMVYQSVCQWVNKRFIAGEGESVLCWTDIENPDPKLWEDKL